MSRLFLVGIDQELVDISQEAQIAGLKFSLHASRDGYQISVGGYSDKLVVLFDMIIRKFRHSDPARCDFGQLKENCRGELQAFSHQEPYQQTSHFRSWLNH
jgi:insulysin